MKVTKFCFNKGKFALSFDQVHFGVSYSKDDSFKTIRLSRPGNEMNVNDVINFLYYLLP